MSSIVERIRDIKGAEDAKARREVSETRALEREREAQAVLDRQDQERALREFRAAKKQAYVQFFENCGILDELKELDREFLKGKHRKHDVVIDKDNGVVMLVWGKYYAIQIDERGELDVGWEKRGFLSSGIEKEYSSIIVRLVDSEDGSENTGVLVKGDGIYRVNNWETNLETVKDTITKAFLSPDHYPLRGGNSYSPQPSDQSGFGM